MRATLLACLIIAALSFAGGCDPESGGPHPGTGPGDNKRSADVGTGLGGEPATAEDFRNVGKALLAVQGICGLFRAGNDTALTSTATQAEVTTYAAVPQVPGALRNAVGEYYKGSITPDTDDHRSALTIRRGRVVEQCGKLNF